MAKQSFSVGQVLTAAQMTSLQQTAMLGGSTTAKTTSYTLVAADAGTVVSVNSTSATTITINTGLFSAGDIVTIQNWGSGSVTITAGTATVNTAGSLIVPQYDGGILYFTSTSAAIYFDWVQAGATSPLTTKGDIWGYGSSDARIPIGTNGNVLTADSSESLGLKWAAPGGGGAMVLTKAQSFSASSAVNVNDCFSATYKNYLVLIQYTMSGNHDTNWRFRTGGTDNTASNYQYSGAYFAAGDSANTALGTINDDKMNIGNGINTGASYIVMVHQPYESAVTGYEALNGTGSRYKIMGGQVNNTTSFDGFSIIPSSNNITGTLRVYGLVDA